jgi:2-(1,2-epoxy-1,2-dihydrophenyl)acetyl-CoA isomerase
MTSDQLVQYSASAGIGRIIFNRPDRLNALTRDLLVQLASTLHEAIADPAVKVISLTGAGRAFCAGQDLSERDPRKLSGLLDLEAIQKELFHPVITAMTAAPKPIVASVRGVAAGAGASIALAADIVIASESARFNFSFAKVGLSVDAGGGFMLVRALGAARARALLMLGESLDGTQAAQAGLIWRAVADGDLEEAREALLQQLAKAPSQALASIKKAVIAAEGGELRAYLLEEARLQGLAGANPDYAEGVLSFLEKRQAEFGKQ